MLIYLFTFPNGKHYVGRTLDYNKRLAEHKYGTEHGNPAYLYRALRKYGWDNVQKTVLEKCTTPEYLIEREAYYIEEYNSIKQGYNITSNTQIGGDNWQGLYHTDKYNQFREKMRTKTTGVNNGMYGKIHGEETRSKMKLQAVGRHTLEWFIKKHGEEKGTQLYADRCRNKSEKSLGANNPSYKKIDLEAFKADVLAGIPKKILCIKYNLVSTAFTNRLRDCFNESSLYRIRSRKTQK